MLDTLAPNVRAAHFVEAPVAVETADGFIVVSRFRVGRPVPPYRYDYSYSHYADQADAVEHYNAIEAGEYEGWEAVKILPSCKGVPLGAKVIL